MHRDSDVLASYAWAPDSVTQSLQLHHSSDSLDLRDPISDCFVGRLAIDRGVGTARTADGEYGLLVERERGGWHVAARGGRDQT